MVASMLRADLTVLLTTVNGMCECSADGVLGRRLSVVDALTPELHRMAGGTDGNRFSVGGMRTKLRAAELVTRAGEHLWIADGSDFSVLDQVFSGADVGSLFPASSPVRMKARKRFLAFFSEPTGRIVVDAGAEDALCRQGRSLLPGGVVAVEGGFARGDTVCIVNADGCELGRGVTNYSQTEVARIRGAQSSQISEILGEDVCFEEVVHRNYLVLTV
jgi:glutamate 5-kinase